MYELDKILREHGGLEGLARKIGQGDPLAYRFEDAANDDEPPRVGLWQRLLRSLGLPLH
jgi:hypothetical protein